eukprot:CAMPEP_0114253164 /NCGR_PEP_ID=MMETSP0058-20121206/16240_1 /TAXON_ID=36894 /ORGANISM="Pyramimonas parkeae, CCMP726" /LENGTH=429 /DNA_ID=CAMNT_0001367179 /DNA_START=240 /DNA_END=1526 /DNA_ORIENTATION=+
MASTRNTVSSKSKPGKGAPKKSGHANVTTVGEVQNNLAVLAENLCGNQAMAKTQLILTRGEAAYYVWRQAITGDDKRQEIARKFACIPWLLQLISGTDNFTKHSAIGCLQFLAHSEDLRELIIQRGYGDKALGNVVKMLEGDHDRTRVRAAALLYQVCQVADIVFMLKDYLRVVVHLLQPQPHKWAGGEDARAFAAGILRCFAHCDYNDDFKNSLPEGQTMKGALVAEGVVKPLVELMMTGNTMAQTESVSLLAVLSEEEGVALEILEMGGLPTLVRLLEKGQDEARAHAAGVILLIAVEPEYMDMIAQAGAIAPLVNLLSPPDDRGLQLVKKTKTKRKGAALPPAIELGMQNAAGALRHLSFHDPCIKPIVEAKAIQPLVKLLDSRNVQTFQHATGVLYNIALDAQHYEELVAAKAPEYLTRPLHQRW